MSAIKETLVGLPARLKTDRGFLIRVIVGLLLTVTTVGLGFGLLIRTWVYQGHHTKFALEEVGFFDPNFIETFPQFTFCPGLVNDTQTGHLREGIIKSVQCNFHDITPKTHDPESTQKDEKITPIAAQRGPVKHVINFREHSNCYDINYDSKSAPFVKWQDSHSFIGCRVEVDSYVHVYAYGFERTKPSHVMSHYHTIKNGEATLLSLRTEDVNYNGHLFPVSYEIEREEEELRFHTGGRPDHLYATFSFGRFTRRRYQSFHSAHQFTDVTIGVIGGFGFLFFVLYLTVSNIAGLFFTNSRVGYEAQN